MMSCDREGYHNQVNTYIHICTMNMKERIEEKVTLRVNWLQLPFPKELNSDLKTSSVPTVPRDRGKAFHILGPKKKNERRLNLSNLVCGTVRKPVMRRANWPAWLIRRHKLRQIDWGGQWTTQQQSMAILNSMPGRTGSQCRSCRSGVTWSVFWLRNTVRAALF